MKKIITLLLALGSIIGVQAQTSKEEARRVILGQPKSSPQSSPSQNPRDVILGGGNSGSTSTGSREAEIDQVNREYDAKIRAVRANPLLSQANKDIRIRELEEERARRIREINSRYGTSSSGKYKYKSKHKGNNGKHLGWEKGVGNPHKNGGKPGKGKNKD
jgi:hypothetical protein